ncbi:hypothetical protein BST26_21375, partial [Mycolicibacterium insubricum]
MPVPDVHDPQLWLREPDAELAEFRRSCPVARHPDGRFWVVPGHHEISEMSKDPETYSSSKGVLIGDLKRTV